MINVTVITRQSLGKVVSYYADGADDYYAKDGSAMQWDGSGAKALSLEGDVEQSRFRELLNGRVNEHTKLKRSTPTKDIKERLGYDLTFSAPKGVSLQALVHGDKAIIEAHDKAVAAAVREAERLAMGRKTENKRTSVENTNSLVVAKFRHETSRALDPDLHTHAFVLNMTQRKDGEWRALTSDGIVKSQMHLGNVYKAELAKELEKAGFTLRYERNGTFDLAHFTDHQIRSFSARSEQIEKALAEKGLDRSTATQAEKNQAALATRDKKQAGVDRNELRDAWLQRAKDLGIDFHSREWAGPGAEHLGPESSRSTSPTHQIEKPLEHRADKVLEFAIKSTTERNSIVNLDQLVETSLKHGMGILGIDDIRGALDRRVESGHLIKEEARYYSVTQAQKMKEKEAKLNKEPGSGKELKQTKKGLEKDEKLPDKLPKLTKREWVEELVKSGKPRREAEKFVSQGIESGRLAEADPRYTTHIAMKREREVLQMEREGRGQFIVKFTPEAIRSFLAERTLKTEQAQAVTKIVTSPNQFMGVQGFAGVGKSYMTVAAKELLESKGIHVTSLAPYGSQVKALQGEGLEARTVASFLKAREKRIDGNSVVFIDEAGVIPARQMNELMKVIKEAGARAVFLGDIAQTKAVEAGKPFEQLMKAGMQTARLEDIQRQKNPELLEAVKLAAKGDTKKSLPKVTKMTIEEDAGRRLNEIVRKYAAMTPAERGETLIITGTNESRKALNKDIRTALGLAGKGTELELLNRLDTTQAERRHSKYYEKGAIIVPEKDYKNGLKRGELYTVLDTGPGNRLTVKSKDGEVIQFSPAKHTAISAYSVEKTELAVGDMVKITRNHGNELSNGDRFQVKEVTKEKLVLEGDGRTVELSGRAAQFVGLAYASTVHSAQGLTCDKVLINLDSQSKTTSKDVYYVAISRARHSAEIFTDNQEKLDRSIARDAGKNAALEITQLRHMARDRGLDKSHDKQGQGFEKATPEPTKKQERSHSGPAFGI